MTARDPHWAVMAFTVGGSPMLDLPIAQTPLKHARAKTPRALEQRLAWPEVLRVVQGDWARSYVLSRFREAGFSGDHWADRKAREFMAGLLTAAEDALELRSQGSTIAAERARDSWREAQARA